MVSKGREWFLGEMQGGQIGGMEKWAKSGKGG